METILVLPQNVEQKNTIEAFLTTLKIHFKTTNLTFGELEARLSPGKFGTSEASDILTKLLESKRKSISETQF